MPYISGSVCPKFLPEMSLKNRFVLTTEWCAMFY